MVEELNKDLTKLRFLDENGETYPDWEEKQLGELGSWGKNHSLSKSNIKSDGENKILLYGELYMKYDGMFKISKILSRTSYCSKAPLKHGSIVMPTSGETRHQISRATAVLDDKGKVFTSGDMLIFHPNNDFVISDFLSLSMNSNKVSKEVSKMGQGFSVVHVSKGTWEFTEHSIPSLPEQTKIADFLSNLDERIEQQSNLVELLRKQKQGYSQKLFNGSLRFKKDDGTDFDDWEEKKLGEIGNPYQPKTVSKEEFTEDGYPVYGANGIIGKLSKYNHKDSQVVVSCRGNVGSIHLTLPESWINGNAMVIPVDNINICNQTFLYHLLNSFNFNPIVEGSGQPQITRSPIKNLSFFFPSLPEQEKIAEFLSSLDKRIEQQLNKLEQLKLEKQSYMQKVLM